MWPCSENVAPRMKFPPPTTTASCTPICDTSTHWRAMFSSSEASMPKPFSWQNPSPLILSRTRLYTAGPLGMAADDNDAGVSCQSVGANANHGEHRDHGQRQRDSGARQRSPLWHGRLRPADG